MPAASLTLLYTHRDRPLRAHNSGLLISVLRLSTTLTCHVDTHPQSSETNLPVGRRDSREEEETQGGITSWFSRVLVEDMY